jgi:putative ubiquitin-RnfH superfamily antitoxin RatB of RatAB toxin-antitoxin module
MAIEVEINTGGSVQSLQELINETIRLKQELRNATDPAEITRLAEELGVAEDAVKSFNEEIRKVKTGNTFDKVTKDVNKLEKGVKGINFDKANQGLQKLGGFAGAVGLGEVAGGLGAVTSGFEAMGAAAAGSLGTLAAWGAVIIAAGAALMILLNKMGLMKPILDFFKRMIDSLVSGFKNLTDAMGITSFATDELASKQADRSKLIAAGLETELDLLEKTEGATLRKARTDLELARIQKKNLKDINDLEKAYLDAQKGYNDKAISLIKARENALSALKLQTVGSVRGTVAELALEMASAEAEVKKFEKLLLSRSDVEGNIKIHLERQIEIYKNLDLASRAIQKTTVGIGRATEAYKEVQYKVYDAIDKQLALQEESQQIIKGQRTTTEDLLKLDQASFNLKLKELDLSTEEIARLNEIYNTEKALAGARQEWETRNAELVAERTLMEARYTQAVEDETEEQRKARIEKEKEWAEQVLAIRREVLEKTRKNEEEATRKSIRTRRGEGSLEERDLDLRLVQTEYGDQIADNQAAITALRDEEAKLAKENSDASIKQRELIKVQIQERLALEKALQTELKLKEDSIKENFVENRKKEQETWLGFYNERVLTETQRLRQKEDEENTQADRLVRLRQAQIDEELALYSADSNKYKELVAEKALLESQLSAFKVANAAETNKKIEELAKIDIFNLDNSINLQTKKLIVFSKNRLAQAKIEAEERVNKEVEVQKKAIDDKLALIVGEGEAEKELRAKYNKEKEELEKAHQKTLGEIRSATPEDIIGTEGVLTDEFVSEFSKRIQIASEFNDALSMFSEARLNRELEAAGENEAAQEAARKRDFERQQKFALANAIISGAQAVTQALAVPPPFVGAALAIATGVKAAAQIALIKSQKYQGSGGAGGVGNISVPNASSTGSQGAQPSFSFFGQQFGGNEVGGGNTPRQGAPEPQNITVDVKISESEITTTQQRIRRMNVGSEL